MADDVLPLLQELVRAGADPSCDRAVGVVERAVRACRVERGPGFVWLQPEGRSARLVLSGHLDVVPPGEGWRSEPFAGDAREGAVWGRGACDMKGAIAAMIVAAQEVGPGDWALALTTDEETRMQGARNLVRAGAIEGADLVLVGEPTGLQLGVAHRGALFLELRTSGKAAHGGTPERGESAIARMVQLLQALEGFRLPQQHELTGPSTLNVGTVHGGSAVNMVPAACSAHLDLRVPPPGSVHEAQRMLRAALEKTGVPFEARAVHELEPFLARANPLRDRVRHWLREARPEAKEVGLPYGTEASIYQTQAPCLVAGPGELDQMHVPEEHVPVDQLRAARRFYATLLRAWS